MRFVTLVETVVLISGCNCYLEVFSWVFFPFCCFFLFLPFSLSSPLPFYIGESGQLELCPLSKCRFPLGWATEAPLSSRSEAAKGVSLKHDIHLIFSAPCPFIRSCINTIDCRFQGRGHQSFKGCLPCLVPLCLAAVCLATLCWWRSCS